MTATHANSLIAATITVLATHYGCTEMEVVQGLNAGIDALCRNFATLLAGAVVAA